MNCEGGAWHCPVCNKLAILNYLEVDEYIWSLLFKLTNTDIDEVMTDQEAHWKPVLLNQKNSDEKDENQDKEACRSQQQQQQMMQHPTSSRTTKTPTMQTADIFYGQAPITPQPMPNTSQGTSGPSPYNGKDPNSSFVQMDTPDALNKLIHKKDNLGNSTNNSGPVSSISHISPASMHSTITSPATNQGPMSDHLPFPAIHCTPDRHPTPSPKATLQSSNSPTGDSQQQKS